MRPLPPFASPFLFTALLLRLLKASPALAVGSVIGWGDSCSLPPPPSVDGTTGTATAIAAGGDHSCAIQAGTDAVVCWGTDWGGESTPPPSVDGTTGTASAIAMGYHGSFCDTNGCEPSNSCAIQAETGGVVCWGSDSFATPPASVDGTTGTATAIAAGGYHSCAIQAGTGAVVCWGDDYYGQATPPPSVDGTTGTATAIAAGGQHSCAIQAETGAVICWGEDSAGQATPPPSVDGTTGTATAIAAGSEHSCAIQASTGAVVCWGGDYWFDPPIPPPSVDGTEGTAMAIAAGGYHSCAIQAGPGAVVCWGFDWDDQWTPPPSVDGTTGTATAIAAGYNHTLAVRTPECSDGLDNDGDGLTDYPDDPLCDDLLDDSESTKPMQAEATLRIRLKFNKPSKDKILVKVTDWQLPEGVDPTDVSVNVGGAECTGTLDAEGKSQSPDKRDSITMKQSKKTGLWNIVVRRKANDFAADLSDEGCVDANKPRPGVPVTVPLIINVDGVAYGQDVDLVYKSKAGRAGIAK